MTSARAGLEDAWLRLRVAVLLQGDRARRARALIHANRHAVVSALLIVLGLGGALGGGALVGEWCLGLVLIAESAGMLWFGLFRDDQPKAQPVAGDVFARYRGLP